MKWKEFLKPTKGKIILFVIIAFIIPYIMSVMSPILIWMTLPVLLLPLFALGMIARGEILYLLPGLLSYVVILIVYYIFSCFVIWIYDKHFKKVKK
jgi:hypothetical protein